jgi:hypothetical protein
LASIRRSLTRVLKRERCRLGRVRQPPSRGSTAFKRISPLVTSVRDVRQRPWGSCRFIRPHDMDLTPLTVSERPLTFLFADGDVESWMTRQDIGRVAGQWRVAGEVASGGAGNCSWAALPRKMISTDFASNPAEGDG